MTNVPPSTARSPAIRTNVAYLVDDQAGRPTGLRVVEPPPDTRQAMRGNLYALVDLIGDDTQRAAYSERLLSIIQRTYYTLKGSQSLVLTEALREARRALQELNLHHEAIAAQTATSAPRPSDNADTLPSDTAASLQSGGPVPLQAGILIAALLGERLLIVGSGPALALITAERGVDVYPSGAASALPNEPDVEATPEIYRQSLAIGSAFFLGGRRWLQRISMRELAGTVAYLDEENCNDAVSGLRELTQRSELPGLLVLLTSGDTADGPVPARPPLLRRPRSGGGLPTAVNAQPPMHQPSIDSSASRALPAITTSAPDRSRLGQEPQAMLVRATAQAEPGERSTARGPGLSTRVAQTTRQGLQRVRELLTGMLPDRMPPTSSTYDAFDQTVTVPAVLRAAEQPLPAESQVTNLPNAPLSNRANPLFALPRRSEGSRARLFILLAVLILVLVPVVVTAVYWQQGADNRAEAAALLDLAAARFSSARQALDAGDSVNARAQLTEAQEHIDRAMQIQGRTTQGDELSAQVQSELANVLQIHKLYGLAQPLVRFPADAQPHRVIVVDQDIYVLDIGRQQILRFRFDPANNSVADQAGEVVLETGARVDDITVGRLVDIAWQLPIPGVEDKANLLVLDRNNNVFRYNQKVEGITRLTFADQSAWRLPNQIETYSGRLYITDEGAAQIFRYTGGNYEAPPEAWFAPETQARLTGLQALAIDGDIWLLFTDGLLLRYSEGKQVAFSLDNSVGRPQEPVDMVVGDQGDSSIYLADGAGERILIFSKDGKYQRQLQAAEGNPLRGLRGMFVDEVTSSIFILTQSALYQHVLPQ